MRQRQIVGSKTCLVLVVLGLMASLVILFGRYQSERSNSSVELLMDYQALCDYAREQGLPLDQLLTKCRNNGVTSLAVEETNRDYLAMQGLARCMDAYELEDLQYQGRAPRVARPKPECLYFVAENAQIAKDLAEGARLSMGAERVQLWPNQQSDSKIVEMRADIRQIGAVGFGISADTVKLLTSKYKFNVWVRPWNSMDATPASISRMLDNIAALPNVQGVIFGGIRNEALGFPNYLPLVSDLLRKSSLKLGVIELAPNVQQKGIQTLASQMPSRVVRVMAVSSAQQIKLDAQSVAAMYSLGARERNIRLLYVRPYFDTTMDSSLAQVNDELLEELTTDLHGVLGLQASTFGPAEFSTAKALGQGLPTNESARAIPEQWTATVTQKVAWCLITVAAMAAFCHLLSLFGCLGSKWEIRLLGLAAAAAVVACFGPVALRHFRLALALATLTVMPIWGLVLLLPVFEQASNYNSIGRAIIKGWKVLLIAAGFSLAGGLMAAACLPDPTFMLSLDVFRGVKLHSIVVPLIVISVWLVRQQQRGGLTVVVRLLDREVKVWHLLLLLVLTGIGLFYVVRTGNAGGDLVVSEGERVLRRWLDASLGVRPRFKEFALGNPALLILPCLAMMRWRGLVPFAILAAALGQASLSDTYAHIHTPIMISLLRTFWGILLGGCLGTAVAALCFAVNKMVRPWLDRINVWE